MQEVNSLCTDSRALRAEYCIVGIVHCIVRTIQPSSFAVERSGLIQSDETERGHYVVNGRHLL